MIKFSAHVSVQQGLVSFAPAPKDIVLPAKFVRRINAGFYSCCGIRENVWVWVCRSTRHKTAVGKQVGCPPKQFRARRFHFQRKVIDHLFEVAFALGKVCTLWAHVGIVEAVKRNVKNIEHLESNICFHLGEFHCVAKPGPLECFTTKRVTARPCKGMPVSHRKPQMVFHTFPHDNFIGIVMTESQRVGAVSTLVFDLRDVAEKVGHFSFLSGLDRPRYKFDRHRRTQAQGMRSVELFVRF